jgi:hypothetical protein
MGFVKVLPILQSISGFLKTERKLNFQFESSSII